MMRHIENIPIVDLALCFTTLTRKTRNARLHAMSAMAGFWAACIFTTRKNKPPRHGIGGWKMDEYFKREAAIAIIEEKQKELCPVGRYGRGYVYGSDREKYDAWDEIIDALENIPAADVAPVVRCKDCKHHYDCGVHFCNRLGTDCPDDSDFFCSYGEPKNGGDSDATD